MTDFYTNKKSFDELVIDLRKNEKSDSITWDDDIRVYKIKESDPGIYETMYDLGVRKFF